LKKIGLFLAVVFMIVTLSGCSFYLSDGNKLMSPPKPTGTRQRVQELIYQEAGADIQYVYPANGSLRSAIIETADITGDGRYDVLGFYETPDESGGVTMVILSDGGGQWEIIAKYESVYTCVDKVMFGDLDGDGVMEAVVGWGSPLNQRGNICTYNFYKDTIHELDLGISYTEMAIGKFIGNEDGEELIVAELFRTEQKEDGTTVEIPATATLYRVNDSRNVMCSQINIDKTFVRYVSATVGPVDQGTNAFVLDGVKADNTVQTELLYWSSSAKSLITYPLVESTAEANATLRNTASNVFARDINKDGLLEIPTASLFPGADSENSSQTSFRISWNRFDVANQEYLLVMDTVVNSEYGYFLQLPDEWRDLVTVRTSGRILSVYAWNNELADIGERILKITVYPEEQWEKEDQENLILLTQQSGYVYAAEISNQSDAFYITETRLREYFNLLT
jgi:hypothetical protein